jgi:hypothetical protein
VDEIDFETSYSAGLERFNVGALWLFLDFEGRSECDDRLSREFPFRRDLGCSVGDPVAYNADCDDFVRRRPVDPEGKCECDESPDRTLVAIMEGLSQRCLSR